MRFEPSEHQAAITAAAQELFVEQCTALHLRHSLESKERTSPARWRAILDMGLLSVLAPARVGGLELELPDLIGVAEAAGYVALPEPLVELAGLTVPLLAGLADDRGWLVRVLQGELVALGHPANPFVTDADLAGALLLTHELELHLVPRADVQLTRHESCDQLRHLFAVSWTPTSTTRVGTLPSSTLARGAVLAAAQLVGLGQRCIDLAVAHAKERVQFGKPIGSYQAVKHLLATAQVKVEFARPVVQAAAAELHLETLAARARVAHAKIVAAEAAEVAAHAAVQVHGAMGMTWEVELHLFLKRALALRHAWGTPALHGATVRERIFTLPTGPEFTFAAASTAPTSRTRDPAPIHEESAP